MSDPSRRQAAATLDVPPDADEAAVRSAFLKKLAADGFVPPEGCAAAANRLTRMKLPLSAEAKREAAGFERADLNLFVEQFWRMAPEQRTRTWERLDLHCSDPDVRRTIARLKTGIGVPVTRHEDWALDKLAQFVRENFLLPPREQAVRRLEWLGEQTFGPPLVARAKRLRRDDPATTALDPALMQDLMAPELSRLPVPALDAEALQKIAIKEQRKAERAERQAASQQSSGGGGWFNFSWHWYLVFALISAFARGLTRDSSRTTPNYTPPPQPVTVPWNPNVLTSDKFTAEQVREFKAFNVSSGRRPPHRYFEWVEYGKPEAKASPAKGGR